MSMMKYFFNLSLLLTGFKLFSPNENIKKVEPTNSVKLDDLLDDMLKVWKDPDARRKMEEEITRALVMKNKTKNVSKSNYVGPNNDVRPNYW